MNFIIIVYSHMKTMQRKIHTEVKTHPNPAAQTSAIVCRIDTLLPKHAAQLLRLRHQAISEIPTAFGTSPEREHAKSLGHYRMKLLKLSSSQRDRLYGLWQADHLIGMCGLGRREDENGSLALIYSMYLLPEFRRQGLGQKLLDHCAQRASQQWQVQRCRLCVETRNQPALNLYRKSGFMLRSKEFAAFRLHGQCYDVYHLEKTLTAESPPPESAP